MDASTPVIKIGDRRDHVEIASPPNISPVNAGSLSVASDEAPSFVSDPGQKSATGNSRGMDTARLTPTRKQETSDDFEAGANDLFDSAMRTNALDGHAVLLANPEASIMEDLAANISLSSWSGHESRSSSGISSAEPVAMGENIAIAGGEIIAGGTLGELNLASGTVGGLNLTLNELPGSVKACGTVGDLYLGEKEVAAPDADACVVTEQVVNSREVSVCTAKAMEVFSPVVGDGRNNDRGFATPARKKLVFGEFMTPEMGRARATPGLSPGKRKNTSPQNTPESARRRRHTVSADSASELQARQCRPGVLNTPPIARKTLPGKSPKLTSSTPRRSKKGIRRSNQITIVEMLERKYKSEKNVNVVEGVKQLALVDVDRIELMGSSVRSQDICPK